MVVVTDPKVVVSAQIERDQRVRLERMATREDRTLSAVVRRAVTEYLEARPEDAEEDAR